MSGTPDAAVIKRTLLPRRELRGDGAVAEPNLAGIRDLRVRAAQRRELRGDGAVAEPNLAGICDLRVRAAQRWELRGDALLSRCHIFLLYSQGWIAPDVAKAGKI